MNNVMTDLLSDIPAEELEIVTGGCSGADAMGEDYARTWHLGLKVFPAKWDKYGRAAGPIRNRLMAEYASKADRGILIAFPVGKSRGTSSMIEQAKECGLEVHVYRENPV